MLRLLTLLLALSWTGQAWAHAVLLGSEPRDGALLTRSPVAVVLRFDEAVTPVALSLIGSDGQPVPLGPVEAKLGVLQAAVPTGLPDGTYLLSWCVTSGDSHPVAGSAAFGMGVPARIVLPGAGEDVAADALPSKVARWLTAPALALHTVAVAFWLGAFLPLLSLLRGPAQPAIAAVRRFSVLAVPAVGVLALTGSILSAVQVQAFGNLLGSDYGLLLLAKLAGVAGMVALAACNRLRLTPALEAGQARGAAGLRRSIAAELALAGVVLAVTSSLTLAVPPRAVDHAGHGHHGHDEHTAPGRVSGATEGAGLLAIVEVTPGQAGPNRIAVSLGHLSGRPFAPVEVWALLSHPAAGVEPIRRRLLPDGKGRFAQDGSELSMPGRWYIAVEVLVTDFEQATLAIEVDIP